MLPKNLPRGIWMLGFVSLFMDVSSEMIHAILPLFVVGTLGASAALLGLDLMDKRPQAERLMHNYLAGGKAEAAMGDVSDPTVPPRLAAEAAAHPGDSPVPIPDFWGGYLLTPLGLALSALGAAWALTAYRLATTYQAASRRNQLDLASAQGLISPNRFVILFA